MTSFLSKLVIGACLLFASCKDEQDPSNRHCWMIIDLNGNDLGQVCNRTEAELLLCATNGSCGDFPPGTILSQCDYYQADGPRYCYMINGSYRADLTESQAALYTRCFGNGSATAVRVECGTCAHWYHRIKRTGKANGNSIYEGVRREQFCGDTAATIFQGRQVILKDDADSLVVRQFSNNGTNW